MKENLKKFADTIKKNKFIFVVGLLCICIPPLLFTGNLWVNCGPDFTKHGIGQIGDVIGGTTAPFIGLLGAILIYFSFQKQVEANEKQIEANQFLEKETNRTNFFKKYDTIVDLLDFTKKQYDDLIKNENVKLIQLLEKENPEKETLKKYRCVLDLLSQCCYCICKFYVPTKNNIFDQSTDEYFYKNQLRALFISYYHLYYRAIFKYSLTILSIDTTGDDFHFKYKGNTFEISKNTDVYNNDADNPLNALNVKHIYFIAKAMKNIIEIMENRSSDDYYEFRSIKKPANGN